MLELIDIFGIFSYIETNEYSEQTQPEHEVSGILTKEYSDSGISNLIIRERNVHLKDSSTKELAKKLNQIIPLGRQVLNTRETLCGKNLPGENPNLQHPKIPVNKIHEESKKLPDIQSMKRTAISDKMKGEKSSGKIAEENELFKFPEQSVAHYSQSNRKKVGDKTIKEYFIYFRKNKAEIKFYSDVIWMNYGRITEERFTIGLKRTKIDAKIYNRQNKPTTAHEFSENDGLEELLKDTDVYLDSIKKSITDYFDFITVEKTLLVPIIENVYKFETLSIDSSQNFDPKPLLINILIGMDSVLAKITSLLEKISEEKVFIAQTRRYFGL